MPLTFAVPAPTASPIAQPLQGRTALLTGGATGIGAAISAALATAGANVAVNHLHHDVQARTVLRHLRSEGHPCMDIAADLTDPDAVTDMTDRVAGELGPIDILVNNARAYPRIPWDETGEAEWATALEINLTVHNRMCRAVTASMTERRWGASSTSGA